MTQETLGYIELEWTCQRCGTRNPGSQKTCSSCGAPMEQNAQFELPGQQDLLQPQEGEALPAGPDVHCAYCGTRNPAGSATCMQCGADLAEASQRETGQVLGAFQSGPVAQQPCPFCGEPNPANAPRCKKCGGALAKPARPPSPRQRPAAPARSNKLVLILGAAALILLCVCVAAVVVLSTRTTEETGVVQALAWERTIEIMEQRPVTKETWDDQLPSGAEKGTCTRKLRSTQSQPAPGAEKVCGTPYVVDQGSGKGKVVQDCEYKVYDNWCKYTTREWQVVNKAIAKGADTPPQWPAASLASGQREGDRDEKYRVTFRVNDQARTYAARDATEFAYFAVGSQWTVKVNALGTVTSVQPR